MRPSANHRPTCRIQTLRRRLQQGTIMRGPIMDENISRQILDDLLPSLEALDTKASALLQLLKDKGIATPEEMAAYLDRAANASNVRWRAARVRLDYLLSSAAKPQEEAADKK